MKLQTLCEDDSPDTPQFIKDAIKVIYDDVTDGRGKVAAPLKNGDIKMSDIVYSIRNSRCLSLDNMDIGSTYLEQIISRTINDNASIPMQYINEIRKYFGLDVLDKEELIKIMQKRKLQKEK